MNLNEKLRIEKQCLNTVFLSVFFWVSLVLFHFVLNPVVPAEMFTLFTEHKPTQVSFLILCPCGGPWWSGGCWVRFSQCGATRNRLT